MTRARSVRHISSAPPQAFGLRFRSELELPELAPFETDVTTSSTADELPSMSLSWNESGAIIEHRVWPWQRSESTQTFTVSPPGGCGVAQLADVLRFDVGDLHRLLHAENLGGDIELMLGKRAIIGAFPWRYEGLEGCPCRIVAFLDAGENVEAVGDAAKAILGY